jgi:hypothetical protein
MNKTTRLLREAAGYSDKSEHIYQNAWQHVRKRVIITATSTRTSHLEKINTALTLIFIRKASCYMR